jgi:flavin-binding protein dodecin
MDTTSIAKVIELSGESSKSFDDALQGIAKATRHLRQVKSIWIHEQSVSIENGKIARYHILAKVTFLYEQ